MSRFFARASSEYLIRGSAVRSGYPISIACWFYCADLDNWQTTVSLAHSATGYDYISVEARGDMTGDPVIMLVRNSSGSSFAQSTSGYSANTWHSALGVCASSTNRCIYLDGGSKSTDSASKNFPPVDRTGIASLVRNVPTAFFDGRIAEVAIWAVALNDAHAEILAKGCSPLFIRPYDLVAYWRLIRDEDSDIINGYNMTAYNTPSIAAHPRVFYPVPPAAAALAATAAGMTPLLLRAIEKY